MIRSWRDLSIFLLVGFFSFFLLSCGGTVARYNPGPTGAPTALTVTSTGDGAVSLSWSPPADNPPAYNVYYSTSPDVKKSTGTKFATTTSTTAVVTGLKNDTLYYFAVTAVNSSGEGSESNEKSATPAVPGDFAQTDMAGSWRFNILVSGTAAGWMRGAVTVSDTGAVTFDSFLDSSGRSVAPSYLFPRLLINPTGHIRDAVNADDAQFRGAMATRRNMVVGKMSPDVGSRMIAILQKHAPSVGFTLSGDINGFSSTGGAGGARRFVYSQISTGSVSEWEYAVGQIGQAPDVQYPTFTAPSGRTKPGDKSSRLSITSAGIVSEANSTGSPKPTVLIPAGVMSDDKTVIVATATDSSSGNKYILRIYQMINIVSKDANSITLADLAGTYGINQLTVGSAPLWASSLLTVGSTGGAVFSDFLDSEGGTTPPPEMTLAIDTVVDPTKPAWSGIITNSADTTFHGKLSYSKDMVVFTRTASGLYSLFIGLK